MRLWHQSLISLLPRQQLLGQHRECCALRGKGWGKKHSVVNYVFTHDPALLVAYHYCIMEEMERRGYHPDRTWDRPEYRGSALGYDNSFVNCEMVGEYWMNINQMAITIYPEHNDTYLRECIENLRNKGIDVSKMEKLYDN